MLVTTDPPGTGGVGVGGVGGGIGVAPNAAYGCGIGAGVIARLLNDSSNSKGRTRRIGREFGIV
jgi:hypothetical protein